MSIKLNLHIHKLNSSDEKIEIVERKGLGHPDTICDLIVDNLSIRLSQIYKKEFGTIPHFNIDKAFLAAGSTENKFGGGKIISPILFVIGDRATSRVGKKKINIKKIIQAEIYSFLKKNYRFLNEKNFIIQDEIKPGSSSLQDIFSREKEKFLPANDTSALVGFAPLSTLERMVMETEKYLNSASFKKIHPEVGEDIKVMGRREGKKYFLTIAIAFMDRFIKSEEDYFNKKEKILSLVEGFVNKKFKVSTKILINTLDQKGRGIGGCYLSVFGTSADSGDSGEVGRGNRANGLISLNRAAGSEAGAGKNCVSHVGKIYNLLAFKMADEIYKKTKKRNYVWLVSQIGQSVDRPSIISVEIDKMTDKDKKIAEKICQENFLHLDKFILSLVKGEYRVL